MFQYIGGRGLCKSFLVLTILQKMRRPENYQGTFTILPICGTLSVQKDLFHKAKEHIQDGKELSLLRQTLPGRPAELPERQRAYFGAADGSRAPADHAPAEEKKEEKLIVLLRRCGHFLHHSAGTEDTASLLNALTTEERATLEGLLEKCLAHWEKH